jgi:hypothetical protein
MHIKRNSLIVSVLMALVLGACGKPGQTGSTESGATTRSGAKVECENPIELEHAGLSPVLNPADLPSGKFAISSIRTYMLIERTGDSFSLTASASDRFTPHLSCNGVHPATAEPSAIASKDEAPVYGSFRISESLEPGANRPSENQRIVYAEFIADKTPALTSSLVPNQSENEDSSLGELKQERFSAGKDTFVTVRLYKLSSKTLELRYKLELPADPAGKRVIQFVVATYERAA